MHTHTHTHTHAHTHMRTHTHTHTHMHKHTHTLYVVVVITFERQEVRLNETDQVATLRLVKQGRNQVPVTVTLTTVNGSATGMNLSPT